MPEVKKKWVMVSFYMNVPEENCPELINWWALYHKLIDDISRANPGCDITAMQLERVNHPNTLIDVKIPPGFNQEADFDR